MEQRLLTAAQLADYGRELRLGERSPGTGIRVSELRYISVEAVRLGRTEARLKGKIRVILLPQRLCRKLLGYLRQQKTASDAVFRTGSGRVPDRRQIWAELKSLCGLAGVEAAKVFPHNLRHLFAVTFSGRAGKSQSWLTSSATARWRRQGFTCAARAASTPRSWTGSD